MGVFAHSLHAAFRGRGAAAEFVAQPQSGLGAWLAARLWRRATREPRLMVAGRITLAPRQVVALIEADGQRLLVATSSDGSPTFFPLKPAASRSAGRRTRQTDAEGTRS